MGAYDDVIGRLRKGQMSVHDPWEHAQTLLKFDEDISFEEEYYGKIVGARAMLANISNDSLMFYNQVSVSLLTAAYELACREPEFQPAFKYMLHSWTGGLSLTRAKDGMERKNQNNPAGGYTPQNDVSGYGNDFDYGMGEQPKGGLLDGLPKLPKIKTKRPDLGY